MIQTADTVCPPLAGRWPSGEGEGGGRRVGPGATPPYRTGGELDEIVDPLPAQWNWGGERRSKGVCVCVCVISPGSALGGDGSHDITECEEHTT